MSKVTRVWEKPLRYAISISSQGGEVSLLTVWQWKWIFVSHNVKWATDQWTSTEKQEQHSVRVPRVWDRNRQPFGHTPAFLPIRPWLLCVQHFSSSLSGIKTGSAFPVLGAIYYCWIEWTLNQQHRFWSVNSFCRRPSVEAVFTSHYRSSRCTYEQPRASVWAWIIWPLDIGMGSYKIAAFSRVTQEM